MFMTANNTVQCRLLDPLQSAEAAEQSVICPRVSEGVGTLCRLASSDRPSRSSLPATRCTTVIHNCRLLHRDRCCQSVIEGISGIRLDGHSDGTVQPAVHVPN